MRSIGHLSKEEQQHYILCDCGEFIDMRNLADVFKHLHIRDIPEPNWTYSVKIGDPAAYTRGGRELDLN